MKKKTSFGYLLGGLLAASLPTVHAADFRPDAVTAQASAGGSGTRLVGVGLAWDWDAQRLGRHAEFSAHTELMLNQLRAHDFGGGSQGFTQVVLLPSLRIRLGQGRSPWFFELGVGASWMDQLLRAPDKTFSTQWNFYDMLGVGFSLDSERRHELGLRLIHISNGGVEQPNPGLDFVQLRYVARF